MLSRICSVPDWLLPLRLDIIRAGQASKYTASCTHVMQHSNHVDAVLTQVLLGVLKRLKVEQAGTLQGGTSKTPRK